MSIESTGDAMNALAECIVRVQAVSVWEGCHAVLNVQPPCYAFQTPPTPVWLGRLAQNGFQAGAFVSTQSPAHVTRHTG